MRRRTGGRTSNVGMGGDTSRAAMSFKRNYPGLAASLGYKKGGKVKKDKRDGICQRGRTRGTMR